MDDRVFTFEFDNLDRIVLLPHHEDFQVAEYRLLGLGMTVNLDTKEVSLILPVEFTLIEVATC